MRYYEYMNPDIRGTISMAIDNTRVIL